MTRIFFCITLFITTIAYVYSLNIPRSYRNSKGHFESFLTRLFDVLTTGFRVKDLSKYLKVLSRHLRAMEFKYTKKFGRHLKWLSDEEHDDIKEKLVSYYDYYKRRLPRQTQFLEAIEPAFTVYHSIMFNDYIGRLQDYASKYQFSIDDDTKHLLNKAILGGVLEISYKDRRDLERILKKAIKEYKREF